MTIESATYINDLISSYPAGTDAKSQGDDHLRLLKAVLRATFPNASKKFYFPQGTSLQTSTVTVATTDDNKLIPVSCEGDARTVNLPQGSTLWDGFTVKITKADHSNNVLTIDGYSSETINGAATITLWQRYQTAVLQWVEALSAWIAQVQEIPAIGTVSPFSGTTAPAGWLLMNGLTIGNANSSGTARANADCRGLFYHLWNNYANAQAAVSSGRGASAQADFDANKNIVIPSMQGRSWFGLDTMGTTDAGVLGSVITSDTTNGVVGGAETITIAQANLPDIDLSSDDLIADTSISGSSSVPNYVTTKAAASGVNFTALENNGANTLSAATNISGTVPLGGSGTALNNMPPARLGSWIIKV